VCLPDLHISVQDYPSRIVHHLCRIVPFFIFSLWPLGLRCLVLSNGVLWCPLPLALGGGLGVSFCVERIEKAQRASTSLGCAEVAACRRHPMAES